MTYRSQRIGGIDRERINCLYLIYILNSLSLIIINYPLKFLEVSSNITMPTLICVQCTVYTCVCVYVCVCVYSFVHVNIYIRYLRVCFWSTTDPTTTCGSTTGVRETRIHCMYKSNCYKTHLVVLFILTTIYIFTCKNEYTHTNTYTNICIQCIIYT